MLDSEEVIDTGSLEAYVTAGSLAPLVCIAV
jgi:hypothetical protein